MFPIAAVPCEVGMSSINSGTGTVPEPSGADRRCWVRHACNLGTLYQPGPGQIEHMWLRAHVHNIAAGGLALVLNRRFEPGTPMAIALIGGQQQNVSRTLQAEVVHAEPFEGSQWLVGCSFSGILSDDELRGLMAQPVPHGSQNRTAY
jgi:hypothetical protein